MADISKITLPDGNTYNLRDDSKQELLVSGVNIKTVNGVSLLGSGDVPVSGGGGGTITSVKTTAGVHTTIDISSGAANFNVPTKTSHLTNDSGFVTTDEKVKQSPSTANSDFRIILSSTASDTETTGTVNKNETLTFNPSTRILKVTNGSSKSAQLSYGSLKLGSGNHQYQGTYQNNILTANRTYTFPDKTGYVALTSDIPSSIVTDVTLDGISVVSSRVAQLASTAVSATDDGNGNVTLVVSGVSAANGGSF